MTTRDRLYEMQQLSGMEEGRRDESRHNTTDGSLESFMQTVDEIRHILMMLNRDRETIRSKQEESLAAGCSDQSKCRAVNDHSDQFIKQARVVRKRLGDEQEALKKVPEKNCGKGRARHEQVRSLITSFQSIMTKFNEDQTEYKRRAAQKIAAYFQKQNVQVSNEKIEDLIENGGSLLSLTRNIHLGVEQKKMLFNDIENRQHELQNIERQMREVEELFEDLHAMVTQQGETIDRIETSVYSAAGYAGRAERNVKEAVELKKKGRKWKVFICIGLIILVLVLLMVFKMFLPF
ncbi:unnamed protein product [Caenorhabditis brenneri]